MILVCWSLEQKRKLNRLKYPILPITHIQHNSGYTICGIDFMGRNWGLDYQDIKDVANLCLRCKKIYDNH
jgi:hypothetical protein